MVIQEHLVKLTVTIKLRQISSCFLLVFFPDENEFFYIVPKVAKARGMYVAFGFLCWKAKLFVFPV